MRRNRKSKRRVNSLMLSLLLTAIMLVGSTYAWFSANRQVGIEGLRAKVTAAEGLQISLDAINWSTSVTINESTLEAVEDYNNYQLPSELDPVSSPGVIDSNDIAFYAGLLSSDGETLTGVSKVTSGKFIAFDIYLKNSSSQEYDTLQLNSGSYIKLTPSGLTDGEGNSITAGVTGTGLEYSTRVAILLYGPTATLTTSPADIRALTAGTGSLVSIWEPNYNKHIAEVVANDDRIDAADDAFETLTLTSAAVGTTLANINASSIPSGSTAFSIPTTMHTAETLSSAVSVTAVNGSSTLKLKGNAIMKARVYMWIEGQDPDCNDTASTGKSLDILLNLSKPSTSGTTPASA